MTNQFFLKKMELLQKLIDVKFENGTVLKKEGQIYFFHIPGRSKFPVIFNKIYSVYFHDCDSIESFEIEKEGLNWSNGSV